MSLPGFRDRLLAEAESHAAAVRQLLEICRYVPGQQTTAAAVEARLACRELRAAAEAGKWDAAARLEGAWLPEETNAPAPVLVFRDAAREVMAATDAQVAAPQRVERLKAALALLEDRHLPTAAKPGWWKNADAEQMQRKRDYQLCLAVPSLAAVWRGLIKPMLAEAEDAAFPSEP